MSKLIIEEGIEVNELENTLEAIRIITGKEAEPETMKRFIKQEQATKFYIDKKMNSCMAPGSDSSYLWLDTGYRDHFHRPIFICLHRKGNVYEGHYTGISETLKNRVKVYNNMNSSIIETNYRRFLDKYKKKTINRVHMEIVDEQNYSVEAVNQDSACETDLAKKLKGLMITFAQPEEDVCNQEHPVAESEPVVSEKNQEIIRLHQMQEELELEREVRQNQFTIDFLMDKMEEKDQFISHLLEIIEARTAASDAQIASLLAETESQKQAMLQIRTFVQEEQEAADRRYGEKELASYWNGHNLLPRNGKILVLGDTCIGADVMQGIAKQFGFNKQDFEFELDYKRVCNVSKRVHNSSRYTAVVFGKVPHKVGNLGSWSGIIEEFKQTGICDCPIEARSQSGDLKVTKESFKRALMELCEKLNGVCA